MFLTPVNIQSGLAYIGTFNTPTLGAYIEWWLNCPYNVTKDRDGNDTLVCNIAGSPLSGYNVCICAFPDGSFDKVTISNFNSISKFWGGMCSRYKDVKDKYESYSLQEVVDILNA